MLYIKVCTRSLAAFTSFTNGRPTDIILAKKSFKETSPPSQAHAFVEIYECKDCCNKNCAREDGDHKKLEKIRTEVVSSGVQTSLIYNINEDGHEDLYHFESYKTIDDVKQYLETVAREWKKYNLYKNSCIWFAREVCTFLGGGLPDELKMLLEFMEKLGTTQNWVKRVCFTVGRNLLVAAGLVVPAIPAVYRSLFWISN